jgi:hypothetical protein
MYTKQLREMAPPTSQNTVGVCNQITRLIHYYISSRLVILLKINKYKSLIFFILLFVSSSSILAFRYAATQRKYSPINTHCPLCPRDRNLGEYQFALDIYKLFKYGWKMCGDLKIIGLLLGISLATQSFAVFFIYFHPGTKQKV